MNPDLDKELAFWCELLGITPANGWKVTWGWADKLKAPTGGAAYGLTTVDGDRLEAHIQIHPLTTPDARFEFVDTCAHEVVHCLGARMQALLDAGRERDAHEYLAETLAPAMVKIQSTPRARAFAKAVKQLPKDRSMDMLSLCMALLKEIAASPGISPELKAKIELIMSQENQPAQTTEPAHEYPTGPEERSREIL